MLFRKVGAASVANQAAEDFKLRIVIQKLVICAVGLSAGGF